MPSVVETLIGDKVVEWFQEGDTPDLLLPRHVWVQCGNEPNDDGEYPYCALELPDVNELCELVKRLLIGALLTVGDDMLSVDIDVQQAEGLDFRHRDILLLIVSGNDEVVHEFSRAVYLTQSTSVN